MPIYYKAIEKGNPIKPDEPKKFYASANTSTTVSHIDVHAVLLALTDEIKRRIVAGESIHLGDLGYFVTKLSAEGVATAEAVTAATIKDVRVRFTPGKDLEAELKAAEFKKSV